MTIETISDIRPKIIERATTAVSDNDWAQIDEEVKSLILLPDQNGIAEELLSFVKHDNFRVRDAVATSLTVLNISDPSVFSRAMNAMTKIATNPGENIYTAGRSAMFLFLHPSPDSDQALTVFRQNAQKNDWISELKANIPDIEKLLLIKSK